MIGLRPVFAAVFLILFPVGVLSQPVAEINRSELQSRVQEIFQRTCSRGGCHGGANPQQGLNLDSTHFVAHTVNQPSRERPDLMLISPGQPDSSYLIQKIRGEKGIIGAQMPLVGGKISDQEIRVIETWTEQLKGERLAEAATRANKTTFPFAGWKLLNLPTTRMVDKGLFLFLISHRFRPPVRSGYSSLFGLDGSGGIFLNLGYAVTDDLFLNLGRTNTADDVELSVKYNLMTQMVEDAIPIGLAAHAAGNWETEVPEGASAFESRLFSFSGQLSVTHEVTSGVGVMAVPGVLVNPDPRTSGEPALVTVGVGGRWRFHRNISVIAEWVPIVSGYTRTSITGLDNRFDSWGTGIEISTGGHVFQVVLSNSMGLATNQYLRGGDLDIEEGELRLGFNIFRILDL